MKLRTAESATNRGFADIETLRYIIGIRVPGKVISIWIKLKNTEIGIWIFNITNCYGKGAIDQLTERLSQKRDNYTCAVPDRQPPARNYNLAPI